MKFWKLIGILFLGVICYADTTTSRMGLIVPTPGSAGWAPKLNNDLSVIDSSAAVLSQPNTFTNTNTFNGTTLFPNLTANQCLQLDASHQVTSQACITPPGSDTQVIYNQGGTFAGSSNFTFNNTTITVQGIVASTMTIRQIVWPDGTVQISSPTATTGPPGTPGSSIYPSTGMPTFPFGVVTTTVTASTVAVNALTNSLGTSIITTSPGVNVRVSSVTFADGTILTSTSGIATSINAILNQSTLQTGASFYVPLGTLTKLVVTSTFSVTGDSITLGTGSSQVSIPTLGVGPNYVKVGSGGTLLTAGAIAATDIPTTLTTYVRSTETLQSGTTFYVSSGTVHGPLAVTGNTSFTGSSNNFGTATGSAVSVKLHNQSASYFYGNGEVGPSSIYNPSGTGGTGAQLQIVAANGIGINQAPNPSYDLILGNLDVTGTCVGCGSGGSSIYAATATASFPFGFSVSTISTNQTNTGSINAITVISTGTGNALSITNNGKGGGALQADNSGAVNIFQSTLGDALVIVSSYTDNQVGSSDLLIRDVNINRNDPIIRVIKNANNSAPEFRSDSPAPNFETVATSTDNTVGRGKWEPFATPSASEILQVNSRCWNNTSFENVAYWEPLNIQSSVAKPGLFLKASDSTGCDSGVVSSSNTSGVNFFTLNNHTVGLTGPQNVASGSWRLRLPSTIPSSGQIPYMTGADSLGDYPIALTSNLTWTETNQTLQTTGNVSISSTLPSGFFTSGGLSINNPNFGAGQWYSPIIFQSAGTNAFEMGYESGLSGVGGGFFWADSLGSIYARLDAALSPNQFVQTGANKNLISYDLFNASPTYTGQGKWTSLQPSTFTALAVTGLTASQCVQTDANGKLISSGGLCGGSSGGSSSLAVNQNGVQITSPTVAINALSPPFIVTSVGGGTTAQWALDPSSVTLQGNNLSATYLTNSSATVTYGQLQATNTWTAQQAWTNVNPSTFTGNVTAANFVKGSGGVNTGVVFQNGQTYANSSTFEWNGSTVSATRGNFTFNVTAGSMTGAGLTSCNGASNALTWDSSTDLFGCQSVAPASGSGNYIQNQISAIQTADESISGVITSGSSFNLGSTSFFPQGTSFLWDGGDLGGTQVYVGSNNKTKTASNATCVGGGTCAAILSGSGGVTAVGSNAGNALTSGSDNTLIGKLSGSLITTGKRNTCIGSASCNSLINGDENTAIGSNALQAISSSSGNTCVGFTCFDLLTTGNLNTAMGEGVAADLTTGSQNVCIGGSNGSVQTCTGYATGSSNTIVGIAAGGSLTQNSDNQGTTFLGWQAGSGTANKLVNSTCLGYNCVVTSSNTMQLGGQGIDAEIVNGSTLTFSSGTITNLNLTKLQGVTPGLVAGTNINSITGTWPNQTINAATQGGGGASTLAIGTGTTSGFTGPIASSPTAVALFDNTLFKVNLQGGATAFITSISTITAASLGALTGNQSITLSGDASGTGATAITVTAAANQPNITTLSGSSVTVKGSLTSGTTDFGTYGSSGTITFDYSKGNTGVVVLTSSCTFNGPSNPSDGAKFVFRVKQDATGSRTAIWATGAGNFDFGTDITSLTLTTTASKTDLIGTIYDAVANRWHIVAKAQGF